MLSSRSSNSSGYLTDRPAAVLPVKVTLNRRKREEKYYDGLNSSLLFPKIKAFLCHQHQHRAACSERCHSTNYGHRFTNGTDLKAFEAYGIAASFAKRLDLAFETWKSTCYSVGCGFSFAGCGTLGEIEFQSQSINIFFCPPPYNVARPRQGTRICAACSITKQVFMFIHSFIWETRTRTRTRLRAARPTYSRET